MKKLFNFKWLLLSFILSIASINQVWAYTDTWRCVPGLAFANWHEGTDKCKVTFEVTGKDSDGGPTYWDIDMAIDDEYVYEDGEGNIYKIYYVTKTDLPNDGVRKVKFMRYEGSTYKESSKQYDGWMNTPAWSLRLYRDSWNWPDCEYGENYKKWTISSGTTVVWDAGQQTWPSGQLYLYNKSGNTGDGDDMTKLGSSQQFYKTYSSDWEDYGGFIFRQDKDWTAQSTNIHEDVSSSSTHITMFTHCGTYSGGKSNWQKVSPAYKASEDVTVYFDNTVTGWSKVYIKYGSEWFNRYVEITDNVVPGTNGKLFYYTFPHDVYYGEYMFADGYGYANYNPIDDSHCDHYTALQASNIASATTLIPTENAQKASTTVLDGYEREVTISSYSGGSVHVTYTDASNAAQDKTSGEFNVQQACVITVTATQNNGYSRTGLTVAGSDFTSGNTYPVRANTTVAATFTANTYNITLNKGDHGVANQTATVIFDASSLATVTHVVANIGYTLEGYYDGSTKVLNADGSFAAENVTGYITSGKWSKYDEDATLTAKFTADDLTFNGTADSDWGTASNWSPACVPTSAHDVTVSAEVTVDDEAVAKSVTIASGGKITIAKTGVLTVEGAISNTVASRIEINSDADGQGALIYDISSGTQPYATINMTLDKTDGDNFQYIASPVGGVSVSSVFEGKDVYTFAWVEGKGWEHRGYYDDFSDSEVIAINGMSNCSFSGQLRPSTGGGLTCMDPEAEGYVAAAQGVNMIPNTLTAPIKIAEMTVTNGEDGAVNVWEDGDWVAYAPTSLKASDRDDVIPALQGYAIIATASGSVSFDYDEAVREAANHNDALRAPKRTTTDVPDYMKISVSTNERKIDLQLSENMQFTSAIDKGWEAIYMEGDGRFGELYAQATEKMSILATDNLEGTVLGFVPGQAETFTISFEGDGKGYYLNDVKEEEATLIEEGNTYEFAADAATNATRFVISKTPIAKSPTSVDNISNGVKARKQLIDGVLYIVRDGKLYNATGAVVK